MAKGVWNFIHKLFCSGGSQMCASLLLSENLRSEATVEFNSEKNQIDRTG